MKHCVSLILVGFGLAVADGREQSARACGWSPPLIEELTLFDTDLAKDPAPIALFYDPNIVGFGDRCDACAKESMRADWNGYFNGAIVIESWLAALLEEPQERLRALRDAVLGHAPAPDSLSAQDLVVKSPPALRERLAGALDYAILARQVEALSTLTDSPAPTATLAFLRTALQNGQRGAALKRDAFLVQRYAFLQLKLAFYQREWAKVIADVGTLKELTAPSQDLAWRARYYRAGALRRQGDLSRSNLELARIHAAAPALSAVAAQDFRPQEDTDWQATLKLANDVHERTLLWRLVGLKLDGLAGAQEIWKLDPKSNLLALLVLRELAKLESGQTSQGEAELEGFVLQVAGTPGTDRRWLMQLVSGHLAARRGDVTAARIRVAAAIAARADDAKVATQARASIALAIAVQARKSGSPNPANMNELATLVKGVSETYSRRPHLVGELRRELSLAFAKNPQSLEPEFLMPTGYTRFGWSPPRSKRWQSPKYLKRMIARAGDFRTEFDEFVLSGGYGEAELQHELGVRHLVDGNFKAAEKAFTSVAEAAWELAADPFVTHNVDCHDCDRRYGSSLTHSSLSRELEKLRRQASGKGDSAAQAALDLGTGLYNITYFGNAHDVLDTSHANPFDLRPAAHWYARAYALAQDRELKARAAFYSAKAELMTLIAKDVDPYHNGPLPIPAKWFPVVKAFSDTGYYQEVLAECGHFRRWVNK